MAYLWWGLVPFYFDAVSQVPPLELLTHRIVWSAILLLGLITILGRWGDFIRCLQSRAIMSRLLVSTILIAGNWYVYIFSVVTDRMSLAEPSTVPCCRAV